MNARVHAHMFRKRMQLLKSITPRIGEDMEVVFSLETGVSRTAAVTHSMACCL